RMQLYSHTEFSTRVPTAKYTKVGETLRHVIPGHMQCSMACGGRACKYENPARWSDKEQVIKGLYSSCPVIEAENSSGEGNRPGKDSKGGSLLQSHIFSPLFPVYFYNFGWKDYGVASLTTILDMVKVMSFAIQEGKMAVHCHAGLGRTGVLLACYLVFTSRMSADQAILFVRAKRPNSIQTRGQLLCVREFAQFLVPLRNVFSCAEPRANAVTLSQYLTRQRHLLHGYEARQMKNVPKIVQLVCKVLLDIAANRQVVAEEEVVEVPDLTAEVEKTVSQQAIQLLGKEMRGKGIPVPSPRLAGTHPETALTQPCPPLAHDPVLSSDQELDPLWQRQNGVAASLLNPLQPGKRLLSYSDSALYKLDPRPDPDQTQNQVWSVPCCSPLTQHQLATAWAPPTSPSLPPQHHPFYMGEQTREERRGGQDRSSKERDHHQTQKNMSSLFQRRKQLCEGQRSLSFGFGGSLSKERGKVPVITLYAELSLEARRLLVARALALGLNDEDLRYKVSVWQTELNSREGAWERLSLERDPMVLAGLMWSWLEQLKEPIISSQDVQALGQKNYNSQHALNSLLILKCIK
uniref:Protein tyrosine phosphatase domain containing 1a n=1 Tax=Hucho hucho TaxID=62062 RepID=A0A4W5LZP0_9TELE